MIHFLMWKKNVINEKHYQLPSWFIILPKLDRKKSTPGARPDFFQNAAGALGSQIDWLEVGGCQVRISNAKSGSHPPFFRWPFRKLQTLVVLFFGEGWGCKKKAHFFSSTSTSLHCENSSHLVQDPRNAIFCSWPAATIDVIDVKRAVAA